MKKFWMLAAVAAVWGTLAFAGKEEVTAPPEPWKPAAVRSVPAWLNDANVRCGVPPIPPPGCKVGACVCDSSGQRCEWSMICN